MQSETGDQALVRSLKICSDFLQSGSPGRIRTSDPTVNSRLLCQLSYWGVEKNPKSNPKQYLKRQRTVKLPTDRYPSVSSG